MTEKERQEEEKLKKCLQTAYGVSDEQLLEKLEEASASLGDSEFQGAENRLFQRIKEMEAEEQERKAEPADIRLPEDTGEEGKAASGEETGTGRRIRFGKRKMLLAAALAAVFVSGLGVTAIGEKNYFFRGRIKDGDEFIFNNDQNKTDISKLEEAYKKSEAELDIDILKLGYVPSELHLEELIINQDRVNFQFNYENNKVYLIQGKWKNASSVITKSDRKEKSDTIYNKWVSQDIDIVENHLDNGDIEYEVKFDYKEAYYVLSGIMPKDEFKKIVENLNFF